MPLEGFSPTPEPSATPTPEATPEVEPSADQGSTSTEATPTPEILPPPPVESSIPPVETGEAHITEAERQGAFEAGREKGIRIRLAEFFGRPLSDGSSVEEVRKAERFLSRQLGPGETITQEQQTDEHAAAYEAGEEEGRTVSGLRLEPEQPELPAQKREWDNQYYEFESVNGFKMSVGWDMRFRQFTLIFPGILRGPDDPSLVRIGDSAEDAKRVFDYAKRIARKLDAGDDDAGNVLVEKVDKYFEETS